MTIDRSDREATLQHGLALLEEQRQAMLARDSDRLAGANARLSDWIGGFRQLARPHQAVAAAAAAHDPIRALRHALGTNASIARRSASHATRALGALMPNSRQTYTEDGRTSSALPRRETFSA